MVEPVGGRVGERLAVHESDAAPAIEERSSFAFAAFGLGLGALFVELGVTELLLEELPLFFVEGLAHGFRAALGHQRLVVRARAPPAPGSTQELGGGVDGGGRRR